jgi:hypothetical protein
MSRICPISVGLFAVSATFAVMQQLKKKTEDSDTEAASSYSKISYELLQKQNAETSNALIIHWKDSNLFSSLAKNEGTLTLNRDREDGEKLQVGIDYAKSKGVIDPDYVPELYVEVDVIGKSPDVVADLILATVKAKESSSDSAGSVVVLCGLSGTGKVS